MLRLMSDEDVPRSIVNGLLLQQPDIDIIRMQDVGLRSAEDRLILN